MVTGILGGVVPTQVITPSMTSSGPSWNHMPLIVVGSLNLWEFWWVWMACGILQFLTSILWHVFFKSIPSICGICTYLYNFVYIWLIFNGKWQVNIYVGSTHHPGCWLVTTRIITSLVGNLYKPLFVTVTGWRVDPKYIFTCHLPLNLSQM